MIETERLILRQFMEMKQREQFLVISKVSDNRS